jgi:hypothetical protein
MTLQRAQLFVVAVLLGAALWPGADSVPATGPGTKMDLSTAKGAVQSYFRARQDLDYKSVMAVLTVTEEGRKPWVPIALNFLLWRQKVERDAIKAFGGQEGLKVIGRVRTMDEQLALDLKRLETAAVEQKSGDGGSMTAKVILTPEKGAPEGLQSDRFEYLDEYFVVKTEDGWKLDFLKTAESAGVDKETQVRFEAGVFPAMSAEFKKVSEGIGNGQYKTAAEAKAAVDAAWERAYQGATTQGK